MEKKNKELIILPELSGNLEAFLDGITRVNLVYIDPARLKNRQFKTIFESNDADYVVCHSIEELENIIKINKNSGLRKRILSNEDISDLSRASALGASFVIVDTSDWKIIPLENIISRLYKSKTKVFTIARNTEEVKTLFTVLELGVDGVILQTNDIDEVKRCQYYLDSRTFDMQIARITSIKEAGVGERVCIDTVSMLNHGEGMLIGSKSNFLFLIHNESIGSSFTSPRPFRVNAGAIYCYTLMSDGNTKYLSELESGSEVLVVNKDGTSRPTIVGRSKIETRPLLLIRAEINNIDSGTIILQNAETIRLVTKEGNILPVTSAKIGDEIFVHVKPSTGRHFGVEVEEYIVEK